MGRERRKERKTKKEKGKDKKGRRGRGRRGKSEDSYYSDYSYYSYSESRSPSRGRRRQDKDRGRRGRSRSRRGGVFAPRRGGAGGYIPTEGPRSPSRDGSPSNGWIFNMLVDREKARMHRDFAEADKIRDQLRDRGVEIMERERRWQHKDGRQGARPNADDKKRPED
mmetsp:Transcript_58824/g.137679  ORF Transcript_58824/g.137679 Transcript_58824/m.137679 type:complete len:167 (+) Transcript_58824:78-578(+)